jgi:hypothetical protein
VLGPCDVPPHFLFGKTHPGVQYQHQHRTFTCHAACQLLIRHVRIQEVGRTCEASDTFLMCIQGMMAEVWLSGHQSQHQLAVSLSRGK